MASKSYEEYLNSVKLTPMSRHNLPIPNYEETLEELVREGYRLIKAEDDYKKKGMPPVIKKDTSKDDHKKLETTLAANSDNPYVKARIQILQKMNPEERAIIERMENGEQERDERYEKFLKAVEVLGDKLSNT
jgi:hypothetical protein